MTPEGAANSSYVHFLLGLIFKYEVSVRTSATSRNSGHRGTTAHEEVASFTVTAWHGGDPTDDEYPDKPPRMRWATYNRLMDRLVAADGVADERLVPAARAWAIMDQGRP